MTIYLIITTIKANHKANKWLKSRLNHLENKQLINRLEQSK
jgi:DNA-binding HxlR family transcriptional regulator